MMTGYRIIAANGDEYMSSFRLHACARLLRMPERLLAMTHCAALNAPAGNGFRFEPVDGKRPAIALMHADLAALNTAFSEVCRVSNLSATSDDAMDKRLLDSIADSMLLEYDAGARDDKLVTRGCQHLNSIYAASQVIDN